MQKTFISKRMETPLFGLRSKAEIYGKAFFHAHNEAKQSNTYFDEQVSLESAFHRFVTSPDVIAYYCMVPLIGDVLEEVKSKCMGNEIAHEFAMLLKLTSACSNARCLKEIGKHLDDVINVIEPMIRGVLMKKKKDSRCDPDTFMAVVNEYWRAQREVYFVSEGGIPKATRTYVMQELLGFNLHDTEESYEERWYGAVWEYINGLNERAYYHMQIIGRMGQTQRELEGLYLTMKNVVTYKSLVMLTMWRFARTSGKSGIVDLLYTEDDHEDWTLVYGTFIKDYAVFSRWHTHNFEGRQVHLNLYYIDFEASKESRAIHLDMAGSANKDCQAPVSFASLFVHHKEPLGLSYMATQADMIASLSMPEEEEEGDDEEDMRMRKQTEERKSSGVAGGMKNYLFNRG